MKAKLTKAAFDGLSDDLKKEYKEGTGSEAGSYVLKVEDDSGAEIDSTAALRARDAMKKERDDALAERKKLADEAQARKDRLAAKKAEKENEGKPGSQAEKDLRQRLANLEKERAQEKKDREAAEDRLMMETAAKEVETLFVSPELHGPYVRSRLKVERVDGKPVVRVLDGKGEITSLAVDDLRKEISTNSNFKASLAASVGGGGGAPNPSGGGGAPKKLAEMTATEEAQFANKNPDAYKQMLADAGQG
jgi:hypothetical protein